MIPPWNQSGLLDPIDILRPTSANRSPYRSDVESFVVRFGTSLERCRILQGYLDHRKHYHQHGVTVGFQWVDGSFTEHIELIEERAPNDVDVITFGFDEPELDPENPNHRFAFDIRWSKATFKVDTYFFSLYEDPRAIVEASGYWYSMWAHRRTNDWKGFVQVDLDPGQDALAQDRLTERLEGFENEA